MDDDELEQRYDTALRSIYETAQRYNPTEKDVEEEVRAVRQEHAHGA